MRTIADVTIERVPPDQLAIAADFWLAMRRELQMPDADLEADWKQKAVAYFTQRQHAGELEWFFARSGSGPIGSAAGFVSDGYPTQICTGRRAGYVAGIFVVPEWRRRGLARLLTETAVAWLEEIGCQTIRLHAAERARPIYAAMGFIPSNEMLLRRCRT